MLSYLRILFLRVSRRIWWPVMMFNMAVRSNKKMTSVAFFKRCGVCHWSPLVLPVLYMVWTKLRFLRVGFDMMAVTHGCRALE